MRSKKKSSIKQLEARLKQVERETDAAQTRIIGQLDREEITEKEANRLLQINAGHFTDAYMDVWLGTINREGVIDFTRDIFDDPEGSLAEFDQDTPIMHIEIRPILLAESLTKIIRGTAIISGSSHSFFIHPPTSPDSRDSINPGTFDPYGNYTPEFMAIAGSLEESDKQLFVEKATKYIAKSFSEYINAALQRFEVKALSHTLHALARDKGMDIKPSTKHDAKQVGKVGEFLTQPLVIVKKRGGQLPKYQWTTQEREQLGRHYQNLKPFYTNARTYCRKQLKLLTKAQRSLITPSEEVIESIIKLSKEIYPEIEESILRYYLDYTEESYTYHYRPANQAIEHAARLSKKDYRPCGLSPKELRKYLPKTNVILPKTRGRKKT